MAVKAKAADYSLVVDSAAEGLNGAPVFPYSNTENDLTDAVLKHLNDGAPIDLTKPVASNTVPSLVGTNSPKKINSR